MEVVDSKVVSGVVIFLVTLLSGVVPYAVFRAVARRADARTETVLDHMQAFACGVFVAICLLYLVPEARHTLSHALDSDLPIAEMLMSLGVFLILIAEKIFVMYSEAKQNHSGSPVWGHHHHGHKGHNETSVLAFQRKPNGGSGGKTSVVSSTYHNYGSVDDLMVLSKDDGKQSGVAGDDLMPSPNPAVAEDKHHLLTSNKSAKTTSGTLSHASGILSSTTGKPQNGGIANDDGGTASSKEETSTVEAVPKGNESVIKSLVLLLALTFHTVFDGMVVGVQDTEEEVWTLLGAIGLHKALEALSISLSLLDSHRHRPRTTYLYLFLFSLVSPLGLAIGTALTESSIDEQAENWASGVLQSIAAGTFMYATFVESFKERFEGSTRLLKVLCAIVGFGCVCTVRILLHHEHEH